MSVWKQLVALALATAITAFSLPHLQPAQAASARVYVLAPTAPTSLNSVEKHGAIPRFEKEFSTSYDHIEPFITDGIKKKVDSSKEGTAGCPTFACPDLHWKVTVKADFAFTEEGQPMLQSFGDPQQQQYGADITAHAQVKLDFDVGHKIWATGAKSVSWDSSHDLFINIDASGKLDLWPTLQSQVTEPQLSDSDGYVFDLTNPQNFSYVHMGDLGGPYCSAVPGTCEDARKQIEAQLNKRLFALLKMVEEQVGAEVRKGTDAGIQQAINLKDQLLNTKLPVVNKSFQELSDAFGLTLDVQPVTYSGTVNVVATLRFSGSAGSAKLTGKVRLPKERCAYVIGVAGLLVWKFPMELEKMNSDLAAKVGSSCSSILPTSSMKVSGYLGADPKVIVPGWASAALPTWKTVGSMVFTGNLFNQVMVKGSGPFQSTGYYECGFEISGLASADIIELLTSSPLLEMLGDYAEPSKKLRYLQVAVPSPQIVLDSYWKLVDTPPGLVIGGEGQCIPQILEVLKVREEFSSRDCPFCGGIRKFITECPQCGIRKIREGLFEVTNPLALIRNPKFKGLVEALRQDEQFPALTAPQLRLQGP
jgi:hypothetical protein